MDGAGLAGEAGVLLLSDDDDGTDRIGSILMQDAFFSAVTEDIVDSAFHPSGVGEMGTVFSQGECGC